jgi:serine/threonine protein kinase
MVHRGIKPSNLILTSQGGRALVKVLDFGLAKVNSEGPADRGLTHDGQMLGTPDIIAPEQIRNARRADIRADIYSLGCTLYYLLLGRPPFEGTALYDILQAHHSMDAMPLNLARPEIPVEVSAIAAKMMAKEPERRFQVPREVAEALKPYFKTRGQASFESERAASTVRPPASRVEFSHGVLADTQVDNGVTRTPVPSDRAQERGPSKGPTWQTLINLDQEESLKEVEPATKPRKWREWWASAKVLSTLKQHSPGARLACACTVLLGLIATLVAMRRNVDGNQIGPAAPDVAAPLERVVPDGSAARRERPPGGAAERTVVAIPKRSAEDLQPPGKDHFKHPDEVNGARSIDNTHPTTFALVNRSKQTVKVY